jgi:hypothetical protein
VGNQLDEKLMDDKVADVGKVNQIPQWFKMPLNWSGGEQ